MVEPRKRVNMPKGRAPKQISASLRFIGERLDPESIANTLGLEFEQIPGYEAQDCLDFEVESSDLDSCLTSLMLHLDGKYALVSELSKRYEALIYVGIFFDGDEWPAIGVDIQARTQKLCAQLGIPMVIRIYSRTSMFIDD